MHPLARRSAVLAVPLVVVSSGVAALLVACAPSGAGNVPTVALAKPDAELAHPFTSVAGVRELGDGRVIVLDSRDFVVDVADFTADTVRQVGSNGDGPGEYRWPVELFALPGDSYDHRRSRGGADADPRPRPEAGRPAQSLMA